MNQDEQSKADHSRHISFATALNIDTDQSYQSSEKFQAQRMRQVSVKNIRQEVVEEDQYTFKLVVSFRRGFSLKPKGVKAPLALNHIFIRMSCPSDLEDIFHQELDVILSNFQKMGHFVQYVLNKDEDQSDENFANCTRFTVMILRKKTQLESSAKFNIIEQSTRQFNNVRGEISLIEKNDSNEFKDMFKIESWMLEIFQYTLSQQGEIDNKGKKEINVNKYFKMMV